MTVVAVDQYFGTDADAWNTALWTTGGGSSSTVTVQSNAGRLTATGATYTYARALMSGVSALTDCEISGTFTLSSTGEQYPLIFLRSDGSWEGASGQMAGYQLYVNTVDNDLELGKRTGGASTTLAENTSFSWTTNPYKFRFQCTGTTIRCKVWLASSNEPSAWDLSATDATHTSGKPALSIVNDGVPTSRSITFDDLRVTDLAAAPYALLDFDGLYIGDGSDSLALMDARDAFPVTGSIEMQARRYIEPLVMSVSRDQRQIPIRIQRNSAWGISAATFRSRIRQYFDVGKNTSARYLRAYADDGETIVRIPAYVSRVELIGETGDLIHVDLLTAQPYWEANNPTTSSTGPSTVTNAGNVAVRPSIAMTQATHKTLRACTVVAATGTSLVAYPIRFALSDANATSTNVFVFVNGVSVPCNVQGGGGASSVVWALVDCAPDGSSTYVDIIYGSGITNPLCGLLRDPDLFDTTSTANNSWRYDAFNITLNAAHPGSWVPAVTGYHGTTSIAYQLTSDGTTAVFDLLSSGTSDYDSMVLQTPTGCSSGGSGSTALSRTTANLGGTYAQAYVRYRTAAADRWTSAWSTRANATVTTALSFSTALVVAAGIENDGATADPATLTLDQGNGVGDLTTAWTVTAPTVNVAAAANVDYYSGTYVVGSYTLTFTDCFAPDGTLTIDCGAKAITSSASGAIYNAPTFSDPAIWAALSPGSNTITDGVSAGDTIQHRDGYG